MGAPNTVKKLAASFIGAARSNPKRAPEILRKAAAAFANLASDPQNSRIQRKLTAIGLDFAGAAAEAAQQTRSDFRALLEQTAQAWDEIGPEAAMSSGGSMEAIAAQRGDAATQALAENSVSIQPASFLNKDATLGRTAAITFNPSPEQRAAGIFATQTVAFWQGAKKESQAMTVDIGCVLPPVQIATSPRFAIAIAARTYAILQYGADGNTQNAITIDVGLGKRVTVVGNYISVVVGMDQGVQGKTGHLDEEVGVVTLGASIGTFAAHTQAPITRSLYFDNLPVNTFSDHVPLPLRAAFVLPPLGASTTDTITYSFEDFNQRTIGEFAYTLSPIGPFMTSYPVPSGAYFVRIKSLQGIPTNALNQAVIPFQLSL